jgi:hypothetical protein
MLNWQGDINIKSFDKDGNLIQEDNVKNLITSAGKNLLAEALRTNNDCEIKFIALGSDNTAVTSGDTTLGNETFRKQVTSQAAGSVGVTITNLYVAPEEAVGTIEEIGFFSGSSASATTDSGTLFARVLYSRTKTAVESIQIERTDTIG